MGVGTMKMVAATKVEVGGGSHHPGVGGRDGCWHHDASHLGLPEYQSARVPEYQSIKVSEYQSARVSECQRAREPTLCLLPAALLIKTPPPA